MRTRLTPALLVLLAPAWIGCRTYATAHGYPEMATQIPQLGVTSTIPKTQAAFCLDRAQRYVDNAAWASGWDTALLIAAGVSATGGVSLSAAAAAMDDSSTRTDVQIGGAVVTTVAAGLIAGRSALDLRETARVERTQAARNVQAALRGIELYALADDPASVTNDAFAPCVASEEAVANALPGGDSSALDAYLKSRLQAQEEAAQQRAKEVEAVKTESVVAHQDIEVARKEVDVEKAAIVAAAQEFAATQQKADRAGATTAQKDAAETASAELEQLKQRLAEAEKKLAAAEAKLQKTTCELAVLSAQTRLDEAKGAVIVAAGRYRRALLYVGNEEARQAKVLLDIELEELAAAKAARTAALELKCPRTTP